MRVYPRACGETPSLLAIDHLPRVYPRACGGTPDRWLSDRDVEGLSPRLRGNGWVEPNWPAFVGSIPALAGERGARDTVLRVAGVYPRACGGTTGEIEHLFAEEGLSPRLRGNGWTDAQKQAYVRSIPALAGERD